MAIKYPLTEMSLDPAPPETAYQKVPVPKALDILSEYLRAASERTGLEVDWDQVNTRLDEYEAYLNEPVPFVGE